MKRIPTILLERWQRISHRERCLLSAMSLCVLSALAFSLIWQPTVQRLAGNERHYQQQRELQAQLQRAQPQRVSTSVANRPLSLRVSESAAAASLEIHQMDTENDALRLTLSGDAQGLLSWLDRLEREGGALQSLTLEKRDKVLMARVVLRNH